MTTNDVSYTKISNELLPCPFCGGLAEVERDTPMPGAFTMGCTTDGCAAMMIWAGEDDGYLADAIAAWNTRHPQPVNEPAIWDAMDVLNMVVLTGTSISEGQDGPHSSYTPLAERAEAAWAALAKLYYTKETKHPDDLAVDAFAAKMKAKLKWEREERNRSGWQNMTEADLSRLLMEHLPKGDPVDVANFCMMLTENSQRIQPASERSKEETGVKVKPLTWSVSEVFGKHKVRGSGIFGEFCAFTLDDLSDAEVSANKARYQADYEQRILSALSPSTSEGEPVAWVTADILAAMKRGERAVPGWKRSADFCIPLYASPQPTPVAPVPVTITDAVETAYRRGHLDGRCGGTTMTEDDDWQTYTAALSAKPTGEE